MKLIMFFLVDMVRFFKTSMNGKVVKFSYASATAGNLFQISMIPHPIKSLDNFTLEMRQELNFLVMILINYFFYFNAL